MPDATPSASILFTPARLGTLLVPNRFVRAATHEYMAGDDGTVSDRQVELLRALAEGEVGLIITGHAYVRPDGKAGPSQTAISDDRYVPGLSRIPAAVHAYPSRVFAQLSHGGRQTKEKFCRCQPVAPSAVPEPVMKVVPRELAPAEIPEIAAAFVQAGRRAKEAGFDGVQLHVAHGYLLSSFLSPHTNRRTDAWGGPLENRLRIVVEILRGLKETCGRGFPVIAKLNATDFLPGGLRPEESLAAAAILEGEGLDGVEVSGGMTEAGRGSVWQGLRSESEEGYFVDSAALFRAALRIPVFGLGGNRTFAAMERIVLEGKADFVSLGRPFIREPFLVRKFRTGELAKSDCVSCNKCFNPRGISCGDLKARERA